MIDHRVFRFVSRPRVSALILRLAICLASWQAQAVPELERIGEIAAGALHSCAHVEAGGVTCWGNNQFGQLGDNTVTQRPTPVDVSGLGGGLAAITSGLFHDCALTTAGGVKCWGNNFSGQLGDNSTRDRLVPVEVSGLARGMAAISAGGDHTCALTIGGGVKCWGNNSYGQLGDGTTTQRLIPVDVAGLGSGVASISAGAEHTCARTTAGGVKCWGYNPFGQLGDNSTTHRITPVDVLGLGSGVAAIAAGAGDHACALTTAGAVKCWGSNTNGELGDDLVGGATHLCAHHLGGHEVLGI